MVRKTQIKQKKSKSQLRKTIKHYSKTNKKGGRWGSKKTKIVHEMPYIQNPFSAKYGKIRFNPGYIPNNNNQYNPRNNNNLLEEGFGVEEIIYNDNGLYSNYNNENSSLRRSSNYNHANSSLRRSSNEYINVDSNNIQNLSSGVSNASNGYIYLDFNNKLNTNNGRYTTMNPIYNNLSKNNTVGEAKLRRNLNIPNSNGIKNE
jgi:hypothetical protein